MLNVSANNGENILLECPRSTTDGMGDYSWVFNGNYFTNNKVRPYAKCCAINFGIIIIYFVLLHDDRVHACNCTQGHT